MNNLTFLQFMANRTVKPGRNAFEDFDDDEFMT